MMTYEKAKEAALNYAEGAGVDINEAYKLGNGFVFGNSSVDFAGILPFAVFEKNENLEICGLWKYLNDEKLCMDSMKEIPFDNREGAREHESEES